LALSFGQTMYLNGSMIRERRRFYFEKKVPWPNFRNY